MDQQPRKNFRSFAGAISDHLYLEEIQNQSENEDLEILSKDSRRSENRFSSAYEPINVKDYKIDNSRSQRQRLDRSLNKLEPINPLDLLHIKEIQEVSHNDKSTKSILNDIKYLDYKLPIIQFEELRLISKQIAPSSNYNSIAPSALAASANLILIGNTNGQILVSNSQGQEISVLKPKKGLGQVTCIDITNDESFAIAGYHFGQICLWDLLKCKSKKVSNTLHKKPVLSIKFWKGTKDHIISGDLLGRVLVSEFSKALVSTSINTFELIKDELGPILSIEPLKPEPSWPHPTDTHRIVAIAGQRKIVVFTLEPEVSKIFCIDKPIGIFDSICPCISWKLAMAPEDPSPLHHILAVAWAQRIILYTFKFAGTEGVLISGYLETDTEIKAMFWLSYEILVTINNAREIRVICSRDFNSKLGDSGKKAIKEETNANRDLALQSYLKSENKDILTYYNTIKAQNRVMFLLGNKEFHKGQLLNWKECIDELNKKSDWLGALAIGLNLYQNKGKKLYGVPRDRYELRTVLQDFASQFCKVVLLPWSTKIAASLEYCIGIEGLDYFFSNLFDFFIDSGNTQDNMQLLMNTLEPYILNGEIKAMPSEILGKMIGYYLNCKQHTNIERIIVHLEPTCIDPRHVLPACEEHNLLTAYIFINTNSTMQSFVNPLKKMYKTITKQKDFRAKLYFAYKLLWYFRLCLKGETFPSGKILPEMTETVISGICKWLIKRKHLQNLMQLDSVTTLNVVWLIFEDKNVVNVITNQKDKAPSYLEIIEKLQSICAPGSHLFHQFNLFVLKTASLPYIDLSKSVYIEVAKFVMTLQLRFNSITIVYGKDIDEYVNNFAKNSEKNAYFADFSEEEKGSLCLKILKKFKIEPKELSELFEFAERANYTEVQIYLLELKKEYSKCVRLFIKCSVPEIKKKVFAWLNEIFKSLNSSEKREELKNDLMIFLNELVEIDSDQTARFVTEWYQNKHLEIVRKLNNAPKLQMKYLGELVNGVIDEDLVFKYVVLLCQHEPQKVKKFLENREDYNFDECLTECLKYQVVEGAAFLNEKLGNVKDALELLLNRADRNKHDFLNNTKNLEYIDWIESDIRECILLCGRNVSRLDYSEIEEYFFLVLKATLQLFTDFKDFFNYSPNLEQKVHSLIKESLEHMMNLIEFDKIITFIILKFDKIPFKHFKDSVFQVLSQHSYQKNIVKRAINLLSNDVKNMTTNLFNMQSRGVSAIENCMNCNKNMHSEKKEKIIVFICGHAFHSKCVKKGMCGVCSFQEDKKGKGIVLER